MRDKGFTAVFKRRRYSDDPLLLQEAVPPGYVRSRFKPAENGNYARSVCSALPKTCGRITGHGFWQQVTIKVLE
ncbi:hypothetical protein [Salibacterium halotolerans]|uniref:hypothetical protein n=1 Tax=Salibacterium halotolerans TaxID=1884432 RepID=UPI001113AA79|nr:hypothetical protein [Salibacterium halotolerans]